MAVPYTRRAAGLTPACAQGARTCAWGAPATPRLWRCLTLQLFRGAALRCAPRAAAALALPPRAAPALTWSGRCAAAARACALCVVDAALEASWRAALQSRRTAVVSTRSLCDLAPLAAAVTTSASCRRLSCAAALAGSNTLCALQRSVGALFSVSLPRRACASCDARYARAGGAAVRRRRRRALPPPPRAPPPSSSLPQTQAAHRAGAAAAAAGRVLGRRRCCFGAIRSAVLGTLRLCTKQNHGRPGLRTCALAGCGAKEAHPSHLKSCAACCRPLYCCMEQQGPEDSFTVPTFPATAVGPYAGGPGSDA